MQKKIYLNIFSRASERQKFYERKWINSVFTNLFFLEFSAGNKEPVPLHMNNWEKPSRISHPNLEPSVSIQAQKCSRAELLQAVGLGPLNKHAAGPISTFILLSNHILCVYHSKNPDSSDALYHAIMRHCFCRWANIGVTGHRKSYKDLECSGKRWKASEKCVIRLEALMADLIGQCFVELWKTGHYNFRGSSSVQCFFQGICRLQWWVSVLLWSVWTGDGLCDICVYASYLPHYDL